MSYKEGLNAFGLSTGGNTGGNTGLQAGSFVLVGSNNISLTQSTGTNQIHSIYVFGGAGGAGNTGSISAGTTRGTLGEVVFGDGGGVSFGINGQTLTATVRTDYLTSQSNQAFSADASSTFQTLSFQNSNGLSFSNNAGAIRLTHDLQFSSNTSAITSNALHSSASRVINLVAATNNTGGGTASLSSNVSFSAANGATFYTSAGNAVVLSYSVPTVPAQTNQTIGVYASSQTTGQSSSSTYDARSLTFRGAGIVSVGNSGGEFIISATGGGAADGGVGVSAGANSVSNGTVVFSNSNGVSFGLNGSTVTASHNGLTSQSNQSLGLFATSNTTQASSGTQDARSLTFAGAGIASVGVTNGSVVISVPSGGGAGDGYNIIAAGTQTANTTGTVAFSNSNGFSFGMSNNSVVTLRGPSMSYYEPYQWLTGQNHAQGSLLLQPIWVPARITATQGDILGHISNSSSAGGTVSVLFGLYTYSGSTASIYSTTSFSFGYNSTAAASSYTAISGTRFWSVSLNSWNVTPGQYLQAIAISSTSSGTAGTLSIFGRTANGLNQPLFAAAGGTFTSWGQGYYSAVTGAFPNSFQLSDFIQTGSSAPRQPWMRLVGTV